MTSIAYAIAVLMIGIILFSELEIIVLTLRLVIIKATQVLRRKGKGECG
jgi:hypothetical protein